MGDIILDDVPTSGPIYDNTNMIIKYNLLQPPECRPCSNDRKVGRRGVVGRGVE